MSYGDGTRLYLLAELARRGEAHGHQLRREAQVGRNELWSTVRIGSIYSTLRRMESDGLVAQVRSEREGQRPERTIYAITGEGRRELAQLLDAALRSVDMPADPFDLAWSVADELPVEQLRHVLDDRLAELTTRGASLEHRRAAAAAYLDRRDQQLFDHLAMRIRTEITFHQRLLADLEEKTDDRPDPAGEPLVPAHRDR